MNLFNRKTIITLFLLIAFVMVSFPLPARATCSCCKGYECKCNCSDKHELQEKLLQHRGHDKETRCEYCREIPDRNLPLPCNHKGPMEKKQLVAISCNNSLIPSLYSPDHIKTRITQPMPHRAAPLFLLNVSFLL